jgi:periplasmic divalent cation tolerance protein
MNDFIFVYITNQSEQEATKIAKYLVKKKLIACANIYTNVKSIYPWKGKIADEKESVLIVKTTEANFENIKNEVEKIHSYTTPCIVKIPVSSNKKYFDWLKNEIKEQVK